jgi:hypothetical protein
MKLPFHSSRTASTVLAAVAWLAGSLAGFTATLSVSPTAVSNTYAGLITLTVGGLTNGEAVRIRKYVDANANGMLDAGEVMVQAFRLIDGQAAVIGGVTNINVPGDSTSTNGTIVASVSFQGGGVGQALSGQYAYVLSSTSGNFTPVTNLFTVTNAAFGQSFTGAVVCSGSNVSYAGVMLFTVPEGDSGMDFVAGALANGSGGYTVQAPVGTYLLMTYRDGYVDDLSAAPVLSLGPGATVTTNLSLVAANRTISGRFVDSVNTNQGLGGLIVVCEGSDALAIGFTDTNGNFSVSVTPGQWEPGTDDQQLASYGYLRSNGNTNVADTTSGNVSNVLIALSRCTVLIYGHVWDAFTNGLPGVGLYGNQNNGSGPYESSAATDPNGYYVMGVVDGSWQAGVDDSNPAFPNYIFSRMDSTNLTAGQAVLHNFVGIAGTNHVTGFVRDGNGNPVTNVSVHASATVSGTLFDVGANTGTDGAYSIPVANGSWMVGLDCGYLSSLGFPNCPSSTTTNIFNADAVVNFVVSNLQITTTNLPDGTTGMYYNQSFAAGGGQPPYSWSFSPGFTNVPFGLTLTTNGVLTGTPAGFGTTFFGVRVTDNQGATADQYLNLNINPAPLEITTTSLPNGTSGLYCDQVLQATGGMPPYNWYLPNGSAALPPGMNLNTNGALFGTPTTNGVFNFYVSVYVNNPYEVATQLLSLTIVAAPLQVTTPSPLPTATRDSFYSYALTAANGQTPYQWSLAPGSPSLPGGLSLSTAGIISGAPTVSGGFWFVVRVTDAVLATNDCLLGIAINDATNAPALSITSPKRLSNGQFQFSFNTAAGTNYTILYTTNLSAAWTPALIIVGPGTPITVIDPNAPAGGTRFYRLKSGP